MARIAPNDLVETEANSDQDNFQLDQDNITSQSPVSESSDDDIDDDREERAMETRANELESKISANPYDYSTHAELVNLYHQLGDLTGLRKSFERFHRTYPLTEKLWLIWIKTEIPLVSTLKEREFVNGIFEQAVSDYLSVSIWLEFVQFATGASPEEARRIFERALNVAGLHVTQSSLLWDAMRVFETAHLSLITEEGSEEWIEQVQRVITVYRRQLKVPLMDMEHTFVEFRVFVERLARFNLVNVDEIQKIYKKTSAYLEKIMPYEMALIEASGDTEKLSAYYKYIEFENGNPIRQNILYERAVVDFALNPDLWQKFCTHAIQIGPDTYALNICRKSIRNVSWHANLWIAYLQALELFHKDHTTITTEFEQALNACSADANSQLMLWLCYLEHCRRSVQETDDDNDQSVTPGNRVTKENLQKVFTRACEHLADTWGTEADPSCLILQFWARLEAFLFKNMEAARKIWTEIFGQGNHSVAAMWLELIALEQRYGDGKHIRKTYQRALNAAKDWPQSIVQSWMNYERDFGTVQTIMDCQTKCDGVLATWKDQNVEMTNAYDRSPQNKGKKNLTGKQKRKYSAPKEREEGMVSPGTAARKRKPADDLDASADHKKSKLYEAELNAISDLRMDEEPIESPRPSRQNRPKPQREPMQMDPVTESSAVFVSNLDYSVDETALKELFPNSKAIRLVKNPSGRSRGYCYVELESPEAAEECLKRDRERLDGRPVFISRCRENKKLRDQQFKYAPSLELHKLFVRGLPFTITREELERIFSPHGTIKDIRLVYFRSGSFKGLAFVEYESPADAARALLKTDNMEVSGHTINVSISAPPPRPSRDPESSHGRQNEPLLRKSKLHVPLVPTILQKNSRSSNADQKPKTNADFREMLLKQ